jgi:hypothetical protein
MYLMTRKRPRNNLMPKAISKIVSLEKYTARQRPS